MDAHDYVQAIRRSWWIVALSVAIGLSAALLHISSSSPSYASSVTFFVNTVDNVKTGLLQESQYAQNRVNSYVQLSSSDRLAAKVLEDTKVSLSMDLLSGRISAFSTPDTVLMTVTVTDPSPAQSLVLAQSISRQFVTLVKDIDPAVEMQVVSGPTLNTTPVAPRKGIDLALGLLLGLVAGLLIAVMRPRLRRTITDPSTLRAVTHRRVLGQIRSDPDSASHPVVDLASVDSARAEDFRRLRTTLATLAGPVIVFTSSIEDEGKTTVAANLAAAFASTGQRVALIEANLRRPRLPAYLGIESGPGLSDVLSGQVTLDDVVQNWGHPSFDVLTAGQSPTNHADLLSGQAMSRVVQQFRERYDVVLLDTAPLLLASEAAAIAALADAVVIVVRAGKTRRQQVAAAIRSLQNANVKLAGSVLTMASGATSGSPDLTDYEPVSAEAQRATRRSP